MAKKYQFVDRAWNVTHKSGKHLGIATVSADDMREAMKSYEHDEFWPSHESIESELLDNSVANILWNNRVDPEDAEVDQIKDAPRRGSRKSYGGAR